MVIDAVWWSGEGQRAARRACPGAAWIGVALFGLVVLSGCGLLEPQVRHVVQVREVAVPVSVPVPTANPVDAAGRQMLAWSEELRALPTDALVQEAARLGDGSASAAHGMRLALVLGLTRNPGDLNRAQQVLEGLLRRAVAPALLSAEPDPAVATASTPSGGAASVADAIASVSALPLQAPMPEPVLDWTPWARWLQARYQFERRMEDQIERQAGQLREGQRRQDQLNEKLEALKAIERQLVSPRRAPEGRPR
ncbi:MAG: hypothetical protein EOP40_00615 [Rubrivivax sp.]|nr:MAG: hypothetical protein EOP40_00615 [Rubrivivax sp.]